MHVAIRLIILSVPLLTKKSSTRRFYLILKSRASSTILALKGGLRRSVRGIDPDSVEAAMLEPCLIYSSRRLQQIHTVRSCKIISAVYN